MLGWRKTKRTYMSLILSCSKHKSGSMRQEDAQQSRMGGAGGLSAVLDAEARPAAAG